MPEFKVLSAGDASRSVKFETFQRLTKGNSILGVEQSERSVRLDLTDDLRITMQVTENRDLEFVVSRVQRHGDKLASMRIQLLEEEEPEAALINWRLWHLRQVYAMAYLLIDHRAAELADHLKRATFVDLEIELLPREDRLYIEASGPGTYQLFTYVKKAAEMVKAAPQGALNVLSLFSRGGREMLVRRVQAGTKKMEEEAALAKAKVDQAKEETELAKAKVDAANIQNQIVKGKAIIDAAKEISEIKDPEMREQLKQAFLGSSKQIVGSDRDGVIPLLEHMIPPPPPTPPA
jgi:hypothetical protein